VILWDKIVEYKDSRILREKVSRSKYVFVEHDGLFRGIPLNLTLEWELFPYVGVVKQGRVFATSIEMPKLYS
jgi:hypothetical protein